MTIGPAKTLTLMDVLAAARHAVHVMVVPTNQTMLVEDSAAAVFHTLRERPLDGDLVITISVHEAP